MRTRIAQIARTAIQEIDRIAQIVRTNEPVLEMNGPQVLRVMKRPQVPLVQKAVRVVTTQLGSQGRFCLPYPEFTMRETGRVCFCRSRCHCR